MDRLVLSGPFYGSQTILGRAGTWHWTSGGADAALRGRASRLLDLNKVVKEENTLGTMISRKFLKILENPWFSLIFSQI